MSDFLDFINRSGSAASTPQAIGPASACLDRFTAHFNACDPAGMDAELHFPHVLLSGAELVVWDGPGGHPADFFDRLRASGWRETRYEAKEPVLASEDKVHFVVTYTRCGDGGEVLSTHRNLWIVTRKSGRWGIALRSY
jgi:hypothetical protein